jgi:serine/threonine-protein kinase
MIGASVNQYRITASVGVGGMGEVFRARDTRLNRDVAIKVLPKDFVSDADRLWRFEQEAKTLAALNHPNVLTIHDAGVHEGAPYLVSELLEGRTLRDELNAGALPVRKATDYALQMAQGLSAAHDRGIIHRDLKPENIFVTKDGRLKILDFGLAKLKENPQSAIRNPQSSADVEVPTVLQTAADSTEPGKIMGTPAYMAPEQVRGERADHRADLFAFGCVLYEMLSGARAFRRGTSVESMNAVLHDTPAEVGTTNPNIPAALERIVERCLQKQPDSRFQSAQDLAFAIEVARSPSSPTPGAIKRRQAAVGIVAVVLLGVGVVWWLVHQSGKATKPIAQSTTNSATSSATQNATPIIDQKSIAVLPFVSMSVDKGDEYLSDGMTEELLNVLAQVPGLRVPGRSSCFAFKGRTEEGIFRKVGEQLHVTTVLEGSVRKAGDKLRITAQLINVADGFDLWSQTYDRDMKDILAVQTEVAQQVVQVLQVKLGVESTRALAKTPTENPEAHRLYLLGRYHFGRNTEGSLTNAMQYFTQALQQDPSYALAYCGLSDCYGWLGGKLLSGKEAWAKEKELAQKALALDPNLADAHLALGIALAAAFDWKGGEQEMKRALDLNPRLALAYDQLAWVQSTFARFDEAIRNEQRAIELDPLSLMFNSGLGVGLNTARRYDEAMAQSRKTLELDPNYADAHSELGWCFVYKGDTAGAVAEFQKATALDSQPYFDGALAYAYARAGDRAKAEQIVRDSDDRAKQRYVSPALWMLLHLGLGEKDKALDWLEKCYEDQDGNCSGLKVEPMFDPLRNEPRFQALLKKVGLDQ